MENSSFLFALVLLLLNISTLCLATTIFNTNTDQYALLAFKNTIASDSYGVLAMNWSTNASICHWIGISCSAKHHRVTALNISGFELRGTIAPHLGNLTFLRSLDISFNNFTGSIPAELSNLRHLQDIHAEVNSFTGEIPSWLGALPQLEQLFLYNNTFSGRIPLSLFKNRRLQILDISFNLLDGDIPGEIGNSSSLKIVYLTDNQFTGSIPHGVFNVSSVIEIDIADNELSGWLPTDMCNNIPNLKALYLAGNQLEGQIPPNLWKCRHLEILILSHNHFNGSIPSEIGRLSMLRELYLGVNHFKGGIPAEIGNLSQLEALDIRGASLSGNIHLLSLLFYYYYYYLYFHAWASATTFNLEASFQLTLTICQRSMSCIFLITTCSGRIPDQVGNLTFLKNLGLASNKLTGELSGDLANLAYLEYFAVDNNSLFGSVPSFILNISNLRFIGLSLNEFSGSLPSNIGFSLFNLEQLYINNNKINGVIPSSITNASKLAVLQMDNNLFSGSIPNFGNLRLLNWFTISGNNLSGVESQTQELEFLSSLTNCPYLKKLQMSYNPLNGILPTSIGNFSTSLLRFTAVSCNINGIIPSEIGNLSNLVDLYLDQNQLTGYIPTTVGKLKQLQRMDLGGNQLQGYIPRDLCQMSNLGWFDLSRNLLTHEIPDCLGELKSLRYIHLYSNKLNSTIPTNLWNLRDLLILSLSLNYLSGQLSSQIRNLRAVNLIDLSSNQFSGDIPSLIDGCQSLEFLFLSNNNFRGSIPQSLGKVRGLRALDLSRNNLSGLIPNSLEDLHFLEYLNASYNRLEGEIPSGGPFVNFTDSSFVHNSALCGATRFQVPPCLENHKGSRSNSIQPLMKYVIPSISTIILGIVIFMLIRRSKQSKQIQVPRPPDMSLAVAWRRISYIELMRGTSSFCETNLLGRGSFGSVFKGILSDGLNVAIKVFNLQLEGAAKSFDTESKILSTVRHRNLVRVIGCCTNTEFKALILAYMPNGSLEKWLYLENYCLDLLQRLKIAIDVALALEHLHHGHAFPMVHCDVKPSNVLLDEDMTAHVGDFGISKLFEKGEAVIQTKTLATIGYTAPEYGSEGKVSTSGDVYSFGVMLLEIFTRKKPTDDMFSEEMSLKEWVTGAMQEHAASEVLAPGLISSEDQCFTEKVQCVSHIFDLAMKCLAFSPDERINMIQTVAALQKIKARFLASNRMRHR